MLTQALLTWLDQLEATLLVVLEQMQLCEAKTVQGGKGQTPYERLNEEQQRMLAEDMRAQILSEMGLLPASSQAYFTDATTGMGVS